MSKELPAEYLLVAYRLEGNTKDRLQISWRCRYRRSNPRAPRNSYCCDVAAGLRKRKVVA